MKTRADQIREYSDDELACLLDSVQSDGYEIASYKDDPDHVFSTRLFGPTSASEWAAWLQLPAPKYPLFAGFGKTKDE